MLLWRLGVSHVVYLLTRQLCDQSPAQHQGHRLLGLLWASIHKQTLVRAFGGIPLWDISLDETQPINSTSWCPEIMLQRYQNSLVS